jgi:tetratricopeptide (TPR) repeat protein
VPPELTSQLALLLIDAKLAPEAIAVLERAISVGSPTFELAFNLGSAHLLNHDPTRALAAYDQALTLRPDSLEALRQAAVTAEHHGELERSLSYWIRAKKAAPEDPDILLGFGRVCLKMDLLDDAEPALEKAAALEPKEPAFQYTLAAAKVGKRQFEDAQRLIEQMLAGRPRDSRLQYALGSILYTRGLLPDAEQHLRESIRLQPDQVAAPYYLALVRRDQGHDEEAISLLEQLLRKHPDHAASCEVLGGLLMTAQRYSEAETYLRNAVRLNPDSVKATYQLGLLLARIGKKDEANVQLARAKTLRQEDEANSRLQLRLLEQ